MTLEAIITAAVALYGALLATFTFVHDRRRNRVHARVHAGYGPFRQVDGTLSLKDSPHGFILAATIENHGGQPIYLASLSIEALTRRLSMSRGAGGEAFPFVLQPGQSYTVAVDLESAYGIAGSGPSRHVRLVYRDQLGRTYRSPVIGVALPVKQTDGWLLDPPPPPALLRQLLIEWHAQFRRTRHRLLKR